jgi:hypothetical protein
MWNKSPSHQDLSRGGTAQMRNRLEAYHRPETASHPCSDFRKEKEHSARRRLKAAFRCSRCTAENRSLQPPELRRHNQGLCCDHGILEWRELESKRPGSRSLREVNQNGFTVRASESKTQPRLVGSQFKGVSYLDAAQARPVKGYFQEPGINWMQWDGPLGRTDHGRFPPPTTVPDINKTLPKLPERVHALLESATPCAEPPPQGSLASRSKDNRIPREEHNSSGNRGIVTLPKPPISQPSPAIIWPDLSFPDLKSSPKYRTPDTQQPSGTQISSKISDCPAPLEIRKNMSQHENQQHQRELRSVASRLDERVNRTMWAWGYDPTYGPGSKTRESY